MFCDIVYVPFNVYNYRAGADEERNQLLHLYCIFASMCLSRPRLSNNCIRNYQLPLIITALLYVDLINVDYLTACAFSGHHDVALFERRRQ